MQECAVALPTIRVELPRIFVLFFGGFIRLNAGYVDIILMMYLPLIRSLCTGVLVHGFLLSI